MRKSTTSLQNCFIALSIAELVCSCTGNPHRSENKIPVDSAVRTEVITRLPDTIAANAFTGTFEYSQPNEDGYLYYKLELIQQGDSVKGKLYAANYLAYQSGGYTNPNVLMECDVAGSKEEEGGKRFMTILLNVTRYEKMEDGAPFLKEKMNFPDMEVEVDATFWKLMIENDVLNSSNGQLTADGEMQLLEWERIQ